MGENHVLGIFNPSINNVRSDKLEVGMWATAILRHGVGWVARSSEARICSGVGSVVLRVRVARSSSSV